MVEDGFGQRKRATRGHLHLDTHLNFSSLVSLIFFSLSDSLTERFVHAMRQERLSSKNVQVDCRAGVVTCDCKAFFSLNTFLLIYILGRHSFKGLHADQNIFGYRLDRKEYFL